jgi:hypothetical protein
VRSAARLLRYGKSGNSRVKNICVIPVPESWLKRTYGKK